MRHQCVVPLPRGDGAAPLDRATGMAHRAADACRNKGVGAALAKEELRPLEIRPIDLAVQEVGLGLLSK